MDQRKEGPPAPWTIPGAAARLLGLALAYYGLAWVGLRFALSDAVASPIWPPAGLAVAAGVLWGRRALPAVFVGAFLVELTADVPAQWSLVMAAGTAAEAFVASAIARRVGGPDALHKLSGVLWFSAAAALAPIAAASTGLLGLVASGIVPASSGFGVWWTWYLGDLAGILVVAPPLLLLRPRALRSMAAGRWAEAGGALLVLLASMVVIGRVDQPIGFLAIPPVVWIAVRFGPGAASWLILVLDMTVVAATAAGRGPLADEAANTAFLILQAFALTASLLGLTVAAISSDARRFAWTLEHRVAERTSRLEEVNGLLSREVAERRRAQAMVDDAQRIAQVGTWRWDLSQPAAEWSAELYRIYGLEPSAHVPTYDDYLTRVHPDDVEMVKADTAALVEQRRPYSHQERVRHADGTWRELHTWASPVVEDGRLVALVGACQDVTVQKVADAALRESLERFRALAEASPIGIVHTTALGSVDYANRAWVGITGIVDYRNDALVRGAIHPEDQPKSWELWSKALKEGKEFTSDMRWVRPDGIVKVTSCRAVPIRDAAGTITGFVSTVEDVTDRRAAEEKDREVRRLREQAEFKTNFLRTAAHELGTPLTPIKIQMRILRDLLRTPGRGEMEEERKAAEILERNISRLQVLVQDMLESARLQSGRLRLSARPMDMAQVVHEVAETFQEPAIQTGIALDTQGPNHAPMVGDPDRLSQVLYNLLSNAMKFTPEGGQIHVRLAEDGDGVRVTVQDTGSGFTPEQGAQLFQPFTQLHDASRRNHGGSGLGLYISRGIVEQHGGRLSGESAGPGRGSTFSFVVPRASVVAPDQPGGPQAEALPAAPMPTARDATR
jgi:PAS domain S-box-containing protein